MLRFARTRHKLLTGGTIWPSKYALNTSTSASYCRVLGLKFRSVRSYLCLGCRGFPQYPLTDLNLGHRRFLQTPVQFIFNNHPTIPRNGLYEFFRTLLNKLQKKRFVKSDTRSCKPRYSESMNIRFHFSGVRCYRDCILHMTSAGTCKATNIDARNQPRALQQRQ